MVDYSSIPYATIHACNFYSYDLSGLTNSFVFSTIDPLNLVTASDTISYTTCTNTLTTNIPVP